MLGFLLSDFIEMSVVHMLPFAMMVHLLYRFLFSINQRFYIPNLPRKAARTRAYCASGLRQFFSVYYYYLYHIELRWFFFHLSPSVSSRSTFQNLCINVNG